MRYCSIRRGGWGCRYVSPVGRNALCFATIGLSASRPRKGICARTSCGRYGQDLLADTASHPSDRDLFVPP